MAWNARTAGSTEVGSAPACPSTDDAVIASSDTAQLSDRSPKSMTPSGSGASGERDTTTFASVRSRCTACRGSSSASGAIRDQASRAAVSSRVAVRRVSDVRTQLRHDVSAVAQIPLQDPVQAGMAEALQRPAHPACDVAEAGDGGRRQVARLQQRAAGQVPQQPHVGGSVDQTRYGRALLAGGVGQRHRHPQDRLRLGDQFAPPVLGLQLGRGERRIGDLEHPDDLAVVVGDHEVLVLLAAQRRGARACRSGWPDFLCLRLAHPGAGSSGASRKLKPDRSPADELHDDFGERVVVVAGRGVSRLGQLDELGAAAPCRGSPSPLPR